MKLLLDTCTFLWIASASPQLSKAAAEAFLDRNNERYLSAASAWEIGLKNAAGCLPLEMCIRDSPYWMGRFHRLVP